jgi:hypothetical protein
MFIPDPKFSIPDPIFFHPGFRIQGQKDSGSRIRIKELRYFNPKNCFEALGNMIRDLDFFYPFRIQGSKRHRIPGQDPQHCLFICILDFILGAS